LVIEAADEDTADKIRMTVTDIRMWDKVWYLANLKKISNWQKSEYFIKMYDAALGIALAKD
jgi:hypothetical protein